MIIYNAKILYGKDFELIEGSLEIKNGVISRVKEGIAFGDLNAKSSIIIPSFINSHVHLLDAIGKELWQGKSLDELVRPPNSLKHKLLKEPQAKIKSTASSAINEMIMNGITYYCEFSNLPEISIELLKKSGISGKILYEPIDVMRDSEVAENLQKYSLVNKILKVAKECDGLGISGVCEFSDAVVYKLSTNYFATHAGEHKISQQRSLKQTGRTEVERAVELKPKFIVHLTNPIKNDLELVARNKLPVICCPRANTILNVGTPPIKELLKRKILVALGTDNVMINSPDMLRELEFAAKVNYITSKEALKLATINAAKIFNLNKGVIEEGKDADFIILKTEENLSYSQDIVTSIIHRADQRNIWKVYCNGIEVYTR